MRFLIAIFFLDFLNIPIYSSDQDFFQKNSDFFFNYIDSEEEMKDKIAVHKLPISSYKAAMTFIKIIHKLEALYSKEQEGISIFKKISEYAKMIPSEFYLLGEIAQLDSFNETLSLSKSEKIKLSTSFAFNSITSILENIGNYMPDTLLKTFILGTFRSLGNWIGHSPQEKIEAMKEWNKSLDPYIWQSIILEKMIEKKSSIFLELQTTQTKKIEFLKQLKEKFIKNFPDLKIDTIATNRDFSSHQYHDSIKNFLNTIQDEKEKLKSSYKNLISLVGTEYLNKMQEQPLLQEIINKINKKSKENNNLLKISWNDFWLNWGYWRKKMDSKFLEQITTNFKLEHIKNNNVLKKIGLENLKNLRLKNFNITFKSDSLPNLSLVDLLDKKSSWRFQDNLSLLEYVDLIHMIVKVGGNKFDFLTFMNLDHIKEFIKKTDGLPIQNLETATTYSKNIHIILKDWYDARHGYYSNNSSIEQAMNQMPIQFLIDLSNKFIKQDPSVSINKIEDMITFVSDPKSESKVQNILNQLSENIKNKYKELFQEASNKKNIGSFFLLHILECIDKYKNITEPYDIKKSTIVNLDNIILMGADSPDEQKEKTFQAFGNAFMQHVFDFTKIVNYELNSERYKVFHHFPLKDYKAIQNVMFSLQIPQNNQDKSSLIDCIAQELIQPGSLSFEQSHNDIDIIIKNLDRELNQTKECLDIKVDHNQNSKLYTQQSEQETIKKCFVDFQKKIKKFIEKNTTNY